MSQPTPKPSQTPLQAKPKFKPLEIKPEDLERVRRARERAEAAKVDDEWRFTAEFGYYFGWAGAKAILFDEIDIDTAQKLLAGARKTWYTQVIDTAVATQVAVASTKSKNPASVMKKGLANYMKEAKQ